MHHTEENPKKLRGTLKVALHELVDSASVYLELLEQLSAKPGVADRDLKLDVDLAVTNPFVHASSTKKLFERLLDSFPDETDSHRR